MPTIPQLPQATAIGPTDQLMLNQGGSSYSVTIATLLAAVQPQITLAQGALLGRVTAGAGGPQPVGVGGGLLMASGTLAVDTSIVATLASPALSGRPTAPTQPAADNSQAIATTAFVAANPPALTFSGDITGNGSSEITLVLPPVTNPGVFTKVTVNAKGQVLAGGSLTAADVVRSLGYTPYDAGNPQGFLTSGGLGTMAAQAAASVQITGGSIAGADISGAVARAANGTVLRSTSARAADCLNVLEFGADQTGVADSAHAFATAMTAGGTASARVFVPRGTYLLNSVVNQPAGVSVAIELDDGATLTGPGYLGVDRVETHQGSFRLSQVSGGFGAFPTSIGAAANPAFNTDIISNTAQNSASARIAWSRNYQNSNRYSKFSGGIDFAEQSIFSWPRLVDNTSGWGHWEVIQGASYDEDTAARAGLDASAEHSEYDIVNNGPESGYAYTSGVGNPVQGMSMDPWGQNGAYGGHILYAYGSVGSFDGQHGGLNRRWISYPAVYSAGNPPTVPVGATLVFTMDLTAKAACVLNASGGVASVSLVNGGGAYTSAPSVVFAGGGGSGAAGLATMVGGSLVGVTITNPGTGYLSAPQVTFAGGGVAAPVATTITLNPDGAHGDLGSIAAMVRGAGVPFVSASVANWGGAVSSLVIFGTAPGDLGTLTLGGSALPVLGMAAQSYATARDDTAIAFATGSVAAGDQLVLNGTTLTIGGKGGLSDVIHAVMQANLPGVLADMTANGQLVLTAWMPQQPCGLVLSQPIGFSTLGKLGLAAGAILPPTPPKALASAAGEIGVPACRTTDAISVAATDLTGTTYGPLTVTLNGGAGTGGVADVVTSIQAALQAAGWLSLVTTRLSSPPGIVACFTRGPAARPGIVIRNVAGEP